MEVSPMKTGARGVGMHSKRIHICQGGVPSYSSRRWQSGSRRDHGFVYESRLVSRDRGVGSVSRGRGGRDEEHDAPCVWGKRCKSRRMSMHVGANVLHRRQGRRRAMCCHSQRIRYNRQRPQHGHEVPIHRGCVREAVQASPPGSTCRNPMFNSPTQTPMLTFKRLDLLDLAVAFIFFFFSPEVSTSHASWPPLHWWGAITLPVNTRPSSRP